MKYDKKWYDTVLKKESEYFGVTITNGMYYTLQEKDRCQPSEFIRLLFPNYDSDILELTELKLTKHNNTSHENTSSE